MENNNLILCAGRACDQVAELLEVFKAYAAIERLVSPEYADEEQASVPASRAQLGALLHILNKAMRHSFEELANIAAAMHIQAQLQARPDEDGARER